MVRFIWIVTLALLCPNLKAASNSDSLYCRLQGKLELGSGQALSSEFDAAISTLKPMLDSFPSFTEMRFERMKGEYHYFLGMVNYYLSAAEDAKQHLHIADSLIFAIDSKGTELRARIRREQGVVAYFLDEDVYAARELYDASLGEWYSSPKKDSFSIALTLQYAGQAANRIGEYDKALNYYQQSLSIREKIHGRIHARVGMAYLNIGNVYYNIDDFEKAKDNYKLAYEILEKTAPHKKEILSWINSNLGVAYDDLKDYETAIQFHKKAIEFNENLDRKDPINMINLFTNLAYTYVNSGQLQHAEQTLKKAKSLSEQVAQTEKQAAAIVEDIYFQLYATQGNFPLMLASLQREMSALSEEDFELKNWKSYPSEWATNEPAALKEIALRKAKLLRMLAQKQPDSTDLIEVGLNGYILALKLGQRLSLDYENRSDILKLKGAEKDFEWEAIDCAYQLFKKTNDHKYIQIAFEFAEEAKYRVLLDNFRQSNRIRNNKIDSEKWRALDEQRRTCAELDYLISSPNTDQSLIPQYRDRLLAMRLKTNEIEGDLEANSPEFSVYRKSTSSLRALDVQKEIERTNHAIVEYTLSDSLLFVLTLTKDTIIFRKTVLPPKFSDSLATFTQICTDPNVSPQIVQRYAKLSHSLFGILISPEVHILGSQIHDWTIVPDASLGKIPFEALTTEGVSEDVRSFKKLPYAILKYDFHYAASITLLFEQQKVDLVSKSYDCLGMSWGIPSQIGLDSSQAKFRPLPGANKEIAMLQQMIKGQYFKDNEATEAVFKNLAPKHLILHLALHAEASDGEPKIFFPGGGNLEEDGTLHFHELFQLRLKARMAVLSACETGTGTMNNGEGIHNIASGFAAAGVSTVLMSLWELDDRAGNIIVQHFYDGLLANTPIDVALSNAKRAYLNEARGPNASPFYWAAIVASGNMHPIQNIDTVGTLAMNTPIKIVIGLCILALFIISFLYFQKRKRKENHKI